MLTANFYAGLFAAGMSDIASSFNSLKKFTGSSAASIALGVVGDNIFSSPSSDSPQNHLTNTDRFCIIPLGNDDEYGFTDVVKKNNNTYPCIGFASNDEGVGVLSYCYPYKNSGVCYTSNIVNKTNASITIKSLLLLVSSNRNTYYGVSKIDTDWTVTGDMADLGFVLLGQLKLDTPIVLSVGETTSIGWAINGVQFGATDYDGTFGNDITTGQEN